MAAVKSKQPRQPCQRPGRAGPPGPLHELAQVIPCRHPTRPTPRNSIAGSARGPESTQDAVRVEVEREPQAEQRHPGHEVRVEHPAAGYTCSEEYQRASRQAFRALNTMAIRTTAHGIGLWPLRIRKG